MAWYHNLIASAILVLGVLIFTATSANAQSPCPAVGADTACGVVLTIQNIGHGRGTCSATNCVSISNNQGPFDEIEDTLVGVINNSNVPITSIKLTSNKDIFGFDGDGICGISPNTGQPYSPRPSGCPFGPTGYEGPGVTFSPTSGTTGVVNFNPPIKPNGGTAYFSLEESLTDATTCTSIINNAVQHALKDDYIDPTTGKTAFRAMTATFTSDTNLSFTLAQAATLCGFTGWNWQQYVTSSPSQSSARQVGNPNPLVAPPPFLDPPLGGYTYQRPEERNSYPFYLDPNNGELERNEFNGPNGFVLHYSDEPANPCLAGGPGHPLCPTLAPKGSKSSYTTHLVGMVGAGPGFGVQDTGIGFSWFSNYNFTSGGVGTFKNFLPADPGGSGGITITMVNDVTSYQFPKSLGVSEINGDVVSSGSPAPLIFLGGQVTTTSSGLAFSRVTQTFNGTITITNATNDTIDGPFQIVLDSLTNGVSLVNATSTFGGWPFITVSAAGALAPGQSASVNVQFKNPSNSVINLSPVVFSGSFN